ncbi:MAG: diguanylate cyclase [Caldilineaceae bacterium]|nr:diguanylate cyclase [Caldilineaceae bacterium]
MAGTLLYGWQLRSLQIEHPILLGVLCILAVATHLLKVEGATAVSAYQVSWIAYGGAFVLLNPAEALLVLAAAHLTEWIWHKTDWYIALFHFTTLGVVATFSFLVLHTVRNDSPPFAPLNALSLFLAAATFTLLSHFFVGVMIWLARGKNLIQSGVFRPLTLMLDFVSFGMGVISALIWLMNPYAVGFILSPLYLIYMTLQVPSLQRQTQTEPKTGLYNAKYFAEVLANELERAARLDRPLTVVMADVDLLRNINNAHGHLAGDSVLIGIANVMRKLVREHDIVARFGGEEFAILLPDTYLDEALPLMEKIRSAIAAAVFESGPNATPITATMSFGVAAREYVGQDARELIHNADQALYQAKATTRNRICYFTTGTMKEFSAGKPLPTEGVPLTAPLLSGTVAPKLTKVKPILRKLEFPKEPVASGSPVGEQASREPKLAQRNALPTYLFALVTLTAFVLFWSLRLADTFQWQGLLLFIVLTLVTEGLAINLYTGNTSVSTSVAPIVAGACLFGVVGAFVLTLTGAIVAWIKYRTPLSRLLFNTSNHLLGALLCINFLALTGVSISPQLDWLSFVMLVLATMLNYLITTLLLAGVIQLSGEQSARTVWLERFYWLWPHYLVLGLVAYVLAWGYLSNGLTGVLLFAAPIFMVRISQNQYIRRTEAMVVQLRSMNGELIRRSHEIGAMNEDLILALSHASDLRDPYVQGHAQHVVRYAVLIAKELGLSEEQIRTIRHAGLLHDIGKIGIPETILFKPAKLTREEYTLMKQHAALGAALVREIDSLQHLAPLICHHHESYDGSGYPGRLAGKAIPLEARILSVADAVEAMASDRPYRKALPPDAILTELKRRSGAQFDPFLVQAFTRVIERQGESLIVNSASNILQMIEMSSDLQDPVGIVGKETRRNPRVDSNLTGMWFLSELDSMNMALHRAVAAHRRMELSAQEGRELAETLLKVASTINTTLEQDRVLTLILEQLANVVPYDNASIMLLEGADLNAVARRSIHVPESQFLSVRVGTLAHVSDVLEKKQALLISDTNHDSRWMRRQGSETIRCWLGVPLMVQDRVIGLMNMSNVIPGSYTDHHVQVAMAFAAHAAIAIQNASLYTQAQQEIEERERAQAALRQSEAHLQERVLELQRAKAAEQKQRELAETLSEAARSMSASLNLQEVVHTVLTHLSRLVTSDKVMVKLIDENRVELLATYARQTGAYRYVHEQATLLPAEAAMLQQAAPYILAQAGDGFDSAAFGDAEVASWLGVPLMARDHIIGLLLLGKKAADSYTEDDIRLATAFANQSAITITNARLYQQVQNELLERRRAEMALQEERSLLAQRVEERTFELKAANTKLTAALRTKDEFLATVSHELRTPLSAILLLTESMQKGVYGALGNRHSEVLNTVKHSARHLLALINDILDMSKIESGTFELDMGPVSVPIICRDSLQLVRETANKKQIELVQHFDPRVEMVNGDERRLLQILVNLLSNAVKFTPDGGKVGLDVAGDVQNELVRLTVWDTGIGIAKEDSARLFQPFVQLDSKLSRQYEGTGLGLALVDRLVKMHHGTVQLESEVGQGSRFIVSLPWKPSLSDDSSLYAHQLARHIAMPTPTLPEKPPATPADSEDTPDCHDAQCARNRTRELVQPTDRGLVGQAAATPNRAGDAPPLAAEEDAPLILLVEDNEIGIEAMQDYLTAHDYRVVVARNGEEAIEQTHQHRPDLILMDIQMPDMDGLEATSRIRAQGEFTHTPIIALTALAMPGDRERCMQAGVTEYLSKPVSMKQLVHVIQSQLQLSPVHVN